MSQSSSEVHSLPSGMVDDVLPSTGFNFDLSHRNTLLLHEDDEASSGGGAASWIKSRARKTGTTVAGLIFDGGVVLGSDTRATAGDEIADKNCKKIAPLAPNIYCAGSGTAADIEKTAANMRSQLDLLRMDTHAQTRMVTAVTILKRMLYRYQGYISVGLVIGGIDVNGPHVYEVTAHGFTSKVPFAAEGSGTLAAMSVLETSWREGLTEAQGVAMIQRAILAGIYNDTASGSNCDICILRMDGTVDFQRASVPGPTAVPLRNAIQHSGRLTMTQGLTPILHSKFQPHPAPTMATLADVDVEEMQEG